MSSGGSCATVRSVADGGEGREIGVGTEEFNVRHRRHREICAMVQLLVAQQP
jgi:hypothetical protein